MRKKAFRSIDEVLGSDILTRTRAIKRQGSDRILKSTRLEDKIYSELRTGDAIMDSLESVGGSKLPTFSPLVRDIYQSFYSLNVRKNDEDDLSETAKVINSHIMNEVMNGEDYPSIKSICEGRQLPAYDAATEFAERVTDGLDDLLTAATGNNDMLNTLDRAVQHEEKLAEELEGMLDRRPENESEADDDGKIIDKANRLFSKAEQIKAMSRQIEDNLLKNHQKVDSLIIQAAHSAGEKAEETALTLAAWGQGEGSGPEKMKLDRDTINRVRDNETLMKISRYLGRFKEILAQARKNGYAYGRGEKYTLEHGNDLQRVISSEYAMLAEPSTIPLFLRKYQRKTLKQYRRREAVFKGCGDIIMCLDESFSTKEEAPWGKAVALALLDAAMYRNRKFALIHFSGEGQYKTDVFIPGAYDSEDVFNAVETFLNGDTDFETPLKEALRLMDNEGFENADIVFTTDGVCSLSEEFTEDFKKKQSAHGFTVTGILLDSTSPGFDFSIEPFCSEIYRTSELSQEAIVKSLLTQRA